MTALALHKVDTVDHLVTPEDFSEVELGSSALAIFTDFSTHEPAVIDAWTLAVDAERFMRTSHKQLRLVVDHDREFIGTITLNDLGEAKLLKAVAAGLERQEIQVSDLMRPRNEVRALSYDDLRGATVKSIIETLKCNGEQHCLVVDRDTHRIRGLIAASDIARRLHMPVDINGTPTFAEIFSVLHH